MSGYSFGSNKCCDLRGKGSQGAVGPTGRQGARGPIGYTGPTGYTGEAFAIDGIGFGNMMVSTGGNYYISETLYTDPNLGISGPTGITGPIIWVTGNILPTGGNYSIGATGNPFYSVYVSNHSLWVVNDVTGDHAEIGMNDTGLIQAPAGLATPFAAIYDYGLVGPSGPSGPTEVLVGESNRLVVWMIIHLIW